jgi:hypothetical protein
MEKEKRSKRIAQKQRHIERQVDIMSVHGLNNCKDQPHRFHKRKAMNCGDPGCVMCGNPRKFFKEKTLQEKKFEAVAIDE